MRETQISDEEFSDDDANDGLTMEEIRKKNSGFWKNPNLQESEQCGYPLCDCSAIDRCNYSYLCRTGCMRPICI